MNAKKKETVVVSPPSLLNDIERIALACATAKKTLDTIKRDLEPGQYQGKMALLIDYTITKAESVPALPNINILAPEILAKALLDMGVDISLFLQSLKKAATAAIIDEAKMSKATTEAIEVVTGSIDTIRDTMQAKMAKGEQSGATKAKLIVARLAVPVFPGQSVVLGEAM